MLTVLVFAFVAGILTILSPCTLPVVPLVLGAGATGGRRRGLGVILGFGLVFVVITVLLAAALAALGLSTSGLRIISGIVLGLVGATLLVPNLERFVERRLAPLAALGSQVAGGPVSTESGPSGLAGGLVLGGGVALIWAPCVGPIMAGVIASAAVHGPRLETLAIALAYVAGVGIPLAAIVAWGRRASGAMRNFVVRDRFRRAIGGLMLVTAILVTTGLDRNVQDAVTAVLPPGWSGALIALEQQPAIQEELDMLRTDGSGQTGAGGSGSGREIDTSGLPAPVASSLPASVSLEDFGPAPDFKGITAWINSDPLTMASLKGKVVLVEFWTFGCINCIHVAPYVKAWEAQYADAGLVVVGVHTPELSFERELSNVRDAVSKAGIRYPVAFDPTFGTWHAYRNGYWPAMYFIDRDGVIRHTHIGEGDYEGSEQVIRQLLAQPG